MRTTAALALAVLMAPACARAHELWVERAGGEFVIRYGHRGGASLPLQPAKVKAIRCAAKEGEPKDLLATARFSPTEVRLAARCEAVSAAYDSGFHSLTPDGEVNLPRSQVKDVVKAWESRHLAKWIDLRSLRGATPFGEELEIVPVAELSGRRAGERAIWKVLSQGKPVPGATVEMGHRRLGKTDAAGEIQITLPPAGTASIGAWIRRPVKSPDADARILEASVTFEVSP